MTRSDELAKWTIAALDNSNAALMHFGLASVGVVRTCLSLMLFSRISRNLHDRGSRCVLNGFRFNAARYFIKASWFAGVPVFLKSRLCRCGSAAAQLAVQGCAKAAARKGLGATPGAFSFRGSAAGASSVTHAVNDAVACMAMAVQREVVSAVSV
jgi:hypothetical protein